MIRIFQAIGQIALYTVFAAGIGYFSTRPVYTHFEPQQAMIKISISHATKHLGECHRRTQEELQKLAPNMRRPLDCPRGRHNIHVELKLDGETLFSQTQNPAGLSQDGPATVYQGFAVLPGNHTLWVGMRDSGREEGFDYEETAEITLSPGQNFVVTFRGDIARFQMM